MKTWNLDFLQNRSFTFCKHVSGWEYVLFISVGREKMEVSEIR